MENALNMLGYSTESEYQQNIIHNLSSYTEKFIDDTGFVDYKQIETTYFLENDKWNADFFNNIEQLKGRYNEYKYSNRNFYFRFDNPNVNMEIKFIVHNRFFKSEWSITSAFVNQNSKFKRLADFINKKYPTLNSILDLDIGKANFEWIDWLENKGTKTIQSKNEKSTGKSYTYKSSIACFLNSVYHELFNLVDTRVEWDKDIWDIRNLEKYGIYYNKAISNYLIDFSQISNENIKRGVKRYFKERLLSNNKFTTGTAKTNLEYLEKFINYILLLEPKWDDFKELDRRHIEKYIEWLNIYTRVNLTRNNSNPPYYKNRALNVASRFLSDIQMKEYPIAPKKNVKMLIFPDDKPTIIKKSLDQVDYVPDYVMEQLFKNINNLQSEVVPVVWVMYKTGLRISDALSLKQDCLVKINSKFWIESDIEKTYVEGHRIPIDNELANMLAVLIEKTIQSSNQDNNPNNYIFVRYSGQRKGKPYSARWVQGSLNVFARENNITDEMGNIYHFKNHAFRHTYAIKMLNGGADILTVQELLAHASPEMTMRYAKLLDDTKRRVFDNAVQQGIFSFDFEGKLNKETNEELPKDILDMLWTNHKLNAIDTPYGTCLQRSKGKCNFSKQPPCLTCNGGKPCKDIGVGIFEGDIKKYEIHINSIKALIEQAKTYNRQDMVKENEELLTLYEEIYITIANGNVIYGRLERLAIQGDNNE
jgi:integrase